MKDNQEKDRKYWKEEIQDKAIVAYVMETDQTKRDMIFRQYLHKPLLKLTECIINTFRERLSYVDEDQEYLQQELIGVLLEYLPKWDFTRSSSYSYLSMVAKHYLIDMNKKKQREYSKRFEIDNPAILYSIEEKYLTYSYEEDLPYDDSHGVKSKLLVCYMMNNLSRKTPIYFFVMDNLSMETMESLPITNIKKELTDYLYDLSEHKFKKTSIYNVLSFVHDEYKKIQNSNEPEYVSHRNNIKKLLKGIDDRDKSN